MDPNIPAQPTPPITPNTQTPVMQEPSHSSKTKWVVIGVVLVLLLAISFAGVFYLGKNQGQKQVNQNGTIGNSQNSQNSLNGGTNQKSNPTPNPTAGWNVYTSKLEPSLSFKYPSSWSAEQTNIGNTEGIALKSKNGTEIVYSAGGNYIGGADPGEATMTINQVIPLPDAKGFSLVDSNMPTKTSTYEVLDIVKGAPAVGIMKLRDYNSIITGTSNEQIILGTNNLVQADKEEASGILSTFKFANTASQTDTSNWKTYTNSYLTFNYPSTWTITNSKVGSVTLTSISGDKITIDVVDPTTYGFFGVECMKQTSTESKNGFYLVYLSTDNSGQECAGNANTGRRIMIVPNANSSAPGIYFTYNTAQETKAIDVFNQILSSFKFIK